MPVTVEVVDEQADPRVIDEVYADFRVLDQTFSPFVPGSAVSLINRGELDPLEAGDLVRQALDLCRLYEVATGGYFSAWIGGRLDPSGLVKGWAIDRACTLLDGRGYRNFFVDAGGDIQTRGVKGDAGPWRVGLRHPVERDRVMHVILAEGLAIATSGSYEKGDHILDPHTGVAATDLVCLTVVGPDILSADVYATAAFAMGHAGLAFVERMPGYEAFAVSRDLRGRGTAGFGARCAGG